MDKKVSIIVPVYNIEDYIGNCLNSLVNQTWKDVEIICVDDGSTDLSGSIIKSFAEKDERIIYIFQENAGVSSARNNGIDHSTGEYIMFADGDDYLHYQAVEILLNAMEAKKCNIVFGRGLLTPNLSEKMNDISEVSYSPVTEEVLFDDSMDRAVWGKLFKREVIGDVRFSVGISNAEDFNFMLRLLYRYRNDIGYRAECVVYYYFLRDGSASFHAFSPKNITEIYVNEQNADFFKDKEDCFLKFYSRISMIKALLFVRTKSIGSPYEKETERAVKAVWKRQRKVFLKSDGIKLKDKIMFSAFYYCRHLYELARLIQDPTMKDFYRNRKKSWELKK